MDEFSTPLMRQYSSIKQRHPNALLLFRLGDFYELFFEDAVVASKELQITLTSRNKEKGVAIPMCGVPFHAAEGYIARLVRKGFRVAICDQMEDPRLTKKLVKREVTRVVTPGTAIDAQVLDPRQNNYLAATVERHGVVGLAFADLSTGDYRATELTGPDARARFLEELARMQPSELLMPRDPATRIAPASAKSAPVEAASPGASAVQPQFPGTQLENAPIETPLDDWVFTEDYGSRLLHEHFGVATLAGYGLEGHGLAVAAAGAVLHYVRETQRGSLSHLDGIRFYEQSDCLVLDPTTLRNLELLEPAFGDHRAATLLAVLDHCVTSLGARLLKGWILRPSVDRRDIEGRLEAVEVLARSTIEREELRRVLGQVQDLERLLSKVTLETANARDLLALEHSLEHLPLIRQYVAHFPARRLGELHERLDELADVRSLIEQSIHPEPPVLLTEGNLIRPGYRAELDELRDLCQNSKQAVARIEARERERTRIASL
ncbi:MAG TPA: DNA mismatch repair protein MutS, partial [Terriglobia bacterium]|nr:DNA mismatch repair protein MutS [Terriglobia bacterium]